MARQVTRPQPQCQFRLEELESREVPAVVGGLDPSFATAGKFIAPGGPYNAVALQQDGKTVAVGSNSGNFLIARFNPDGTLDTTFNATGIQTVDFALSKASTDTAHSVVIQSNGKIVVVGSADTTANGTDFAIARLNTNGTLDATFGTGGKLNIDFGGGGAKNDVANGVAIDGLNGDIYVVGTATNASGAFDFGLVRLDATTGALVSTFGTNGVKLIDFGGANDIGNAIAVQADGQVVVGGSSDAVVANGVDFAVARLNPTTGAADATFNGTGQKLITFSASADAAEALAIQVDGRIVIAGTVGTAGAKDAGVARLNTNGTLDTSFNTTGIKSVDFGGGTDSANGVAIQSDGKIVLAGDNGSDIAIARLNNNDGSLDASFGTAGLQKVDVNGVDQGKGVVLTPTGRIIVTGLANGGVDGSLIRVIGRTEDGQQVLGVSGSMDGKAETFISNSTGAFGSTPASTITPFAGFTGNVRTAMADVNGDGIPDTVVVTGPGTAIRVTVISGVDGKTVLVPAFDPFGGNFTGGGFVASADIDNDGKAEFVVTPDQGGGPRVSIFSFAGVGTTPTLRANFFGIDDPNFRGGARAALGDVNGDGVQDLAVAAGFLGGPRTALFNGKTLFTTPTRLVNDFYAFPGADAVNLRNGVYVAIGDINGDGFGDLIFGAGPGGSPRVFILSGATVSTGNVIGAQANPIANFFVAGNSSDRGGVRVAATDADGDNKADLAIGSGEGSNANARVYLGKNFTTSGEPSLFQDLAIFGGGVLPGGVFVG